MPEYLVIIQYDDRFQYKAFKEFRIAHTYFFQMMDVIGLGADKIIQMSLFRYEHDDYKCVVKAV